MASVSGKTTLLIAVITLKTFASESKVMSVKFLLCDFPSYLQRYLCCQIVCGKGTNQIRCLGVLDTKCKCASTLY